MSKAQDTKRQNEMIFGVHSVLEVLKAKRRKVVGIYTTKVPPKIFDKVLELLPRAFPNIQYVSREVLDRMADTQDHMGLIAWVSPFPFRSKMFSPKETPFILLLDAIQDVRNMGAIMRTAYCAGVTGIVLCKQKTAPLSGAAFKSSAGLAEYLEIYVAPSIKAAIEEIKAAGYTLYMAGFGGKNALEVTYKVPKCLVVGSEATGITKEILKKGELITLPQRLPDISYNASVAAGILIFIMANNAKK